MERESARYDKHDAQSDWWTQKDKDAYAAEVEKIKNVRPACESKPGMKLSCSEEMLGEKIEGLDLTSIVVDKNDDKVYNNRDDHYSNLSSDLEAIFWSIFYGKHQR